MRAALLQDPADEILVVHDELDLPPGTARLKFDGGHGGHNGLRESIAHLGTASFMRLRLGIGHPGRPGPGHALGAGPARQRDEAAIRCRDRCA